MSMVVQTGNRQCRPPPPATEPYRMLFPDRPPLQLRPASAVQPTVARRPLPDILFRQHCPPDETLSHADKATPVTIRSPDEISGIQADLALAMSDCHDVNLKDLDGRSDAVVSHTLMSNRKRDTCTVGPASAYD
jgi:hypothetical protein